MPEFDTIDEFMDWLISLNPKEEISMHELYTAYFNEDLLDMEIL